MHCCHPKRGGPGVQAMLQDEPRGMLPLKRCPRSPSGPHPHVHLVPLFGGSVTDLPGLGTVSSEIYSVR